jgi:transcription-repair coupling factor (superfamily II helicase)
MVVVRCIRNMTSLSKVQSPTLDSLRRALEISSEEIQLVGSTNPSFLAWLLVNEKSPSPRLVITYNSKMASQLASDIRALDPKQTPYLLEPFDENPYSGLYPNKSVVQGRTRFLWKAQSSSSDDIFISSIEALLQKTLPLRLFQQFELKLRKSEEVDLDLFTRQLVQCGYESAPMVEDGGTFSRRGGILDIFSPTLENPVRIEFFGDQIESIRIFDPETQRSEKELEEVTIIPAREILFTDEILAHGRSEIKKFCDGHKISKEARDILLEPLKQRIYSYGIDYWLPYFYEKPASPLSAFKKSPLIFWLDDFEITRAADGLLGNYKEKYRSQLAANQPAADPELLYASFDLLKKDSSLKSIQVTKIHVDSQNTKAERVLNFKVFDTSDLSTVVRAAREAKKDFFLPAVEKILEWQKEGMRIFVFSASQTQAQRIKYLFETHGLLADLVDPVASDFNGWLKAQDNSSTLVHIIPRFISESGRFSSEGLVFIREEDIFGSKTHRETRRTKGTLEQRLNTLSFGDLNPGDLIVHVLHGIGVYEGLKKIEVQGIENEFIQLKYKDNDKLYLPVYRISQVQKYSGPGGSPIIDKLGSTSWQRAKVKVRSELKDLAAELLDLYAKRSNLEGFSFSPLDDEFREFEAMFPYDETPDQAKAIDDVLKDMQSHKPMDRLVCGDVGFGKTEVAIRAAFKAVQDKKQVAILVPTTVLAFQHHQNFKKRFSDVAVSVAVVSRFSPPGQVKKDLALAAEGKVDILIGTHRLLSKDVQFKDLGLLVVDEEQKFGVGHKEKIKKFKSQVDVLSLSATPIPRTLNMALMGVRDLSIISTPPEDRLSIRTFINRFDDETIRKAILGEIQRGGQVFFIHNRVQSIVSIADQLKRVVPEVKMRIAHGQMDEALLEKTMLDFYNHEFDLLLCTTIIESGLDIPSANTIIIDRADTFGLSQLYQLRGRVGRSKDRAYAYLLIPAQGVVDKTAQERLKIIQENTELGSGFHIAHHDLELRGSGSILGENQSGHIATVGYELYMELLEQALATAKGEPLEEAIEPEINLRIPALIPDFYIEDIRFRLSYYKALSDITEEGDLDRIELELVDRFGPIPEQVANLFGVMLIRKTCKDLGVRDISAGPKNLSLVFTNATKASPDKVIRLTASQPKKYQLTPDQKLIIRMNSASWPPILEELKYLKRTLF